jgi:hypothetical protein
MHLVLNKFVLKGGEMKMNKFIVKIAITSLLLTGFVFAALVAGQSTLAEEVIPQYDPGDGVRPDSDPGDGVRPD